VCEVDTLADRIVPVEQERRRTIAVQTAIEAPLDQAQSFLRGLPGLLLASPAIARPLHFDGSDPFEHQFVVDPVRPAMERQLSLYRRRLGAWKQNPIAMKIVKPDRGRANCCQHGSYAPALAQLMRQYMVLLPTRPETWPAGPVDH